MNAKDQEARNYSKDTSDDSKGSGLVNGEHKFPLFVVHFVKHSIESESSIVDNVIDLSKSSDKDEGM